MDEKKDVTRFKDFPLDQQIKRAISELGFKNPLEVQAQTIPKILAGKDLIVRSQTGSGKTAAFAIPVCEKIDTELEAVQAVIVTPTRELAAQVQQDINDIGHYKGVTSIALYGNQPMELQRKELKKAPHIVVSTPGRLVDHLQNKNIKLKDLNYLVIDEADEMLLMGFLEHLEYALSKMPEDRVTLLFSATMPEEVYELSQKYMKEPEKIEIAAEDLAADSIEQLYYAVEGLKKVDFIKKIIRHEKPEKCLIFCNTKEQVDSVYEILKKWDRDTCAIHGGMDQKQRNEVLKEFKKGQYRMMIATDLAARGLHVVGITHVINYGVPFEPENYIHRIGRTGRAGQSGVAITLVMPSEMQRFEELETFLGYKIPCKGGYVQRQPRASTKNRRDAGRFKESYRRSESKTIQINGGKSNSLLKTGDVLYAIKSIPGVSGADIGRVDIKDKITNVSILNEKEAIVAKGLKDKGIRSKKYRIKLI